jgi:hypothetical protein
MARQWLKAFSRFPENWPQCTRHEAFFSHHRAIPAAHLSAVSCAPSERLYRMRHRIKRKLRNYLLLLIPAWLLAWITLSLVDLLDAAY